MIKWNLQKNPLRGIGELVRDTHPVHQTHDGFITTYTGKKLSLLQPTEEMICIEDIAHALANICRFGGHAKEFYSVAQHSCLVSYLAPVELRLAALLHDAAEAYLGDVIKPLKNIIGDTYEDREVVFNYVILRKFGFNASETPFLFVKPFDNRAIELEHEYLIAMREHTAFEKVWGTEYPKPCWPPDVAEEMFLSTYRELK